MTGTLFVCATPIGNLEDASPRLIETLSKCSLILAEDTRRTLKLLSSFDLKIPMQSFFQHNEPMIINRAIETLKRIGNVALVSDAGVPTLADPGQTLIQKAHEENIQVIPIPGPSAITTAICASGFFAQTFNFRNFLPRKPGALAKSLQSIGTERRTTVIFESPHRLLQLLDAIQKNIGDCEVLVAREMTKIHESYIKGTPSQVIKTLGTGETKGEITIVIGFKGRYDEDDDQDSSYS